MDIYTLIIICLILFLLSNKENLTTTFVNSPKQYGEFPTDINNSPYGGNYYNRLNWTPYGYHHKNHKYNALPITSNISQNTSFIRNSSIQQPQYNQIKPVYINHQKPQYPVYQPQYNQIEPVYINHQQYQKPMLTSIENPNDFIIGEWVDAGIGYTKNPNNNIIVNVQQLALDPVRELYNYRAINRDGQILNMNIDRFNNFLEEGDHFTVVGIEGDFIFNENDRYINVFV